MRRVSVRSGLLLTSLLSVLCCGSCQGGKRYYPVRGSVFAGDKPATGVMIVFHPMDDSDPKAALPSAIVGDDGSFEIHTFVVQDRALKDGAPAGQYRVTCIWYPEDLQKHLGNENLPDRFQGRYADPKKSELRAEVLEQPTDLPPIRLEVLKP